MRYVIWDVGEIFFIAYHRSHIAHHHKPITCKLLLITPVPNLNLQCEKIMSLVIGQTGQPPKPQILPL